MTWKSFEPEFEFDEKYPVIVSNSAWVGHRTFAYDLIRNSEPAVVVELGTHYGLSCFSMAQAVKDAGLNTRIIAVDTWLGDAHTGEYNDDEFELVNRASTELYPSLIELWRMAFDEAVERIADESVDLIHIDGAHDYASVSHDFHLWLPKLRQGGLIMLNDIAAYYPGFSVHKLWGELKSQYLSAEFSDSNGLGIIAPKGANPSLSAYQDILAQSAKLRDARSRMLNEAQHHPLDPSSVLIVICSNDENQLRAARTHLEGIRVPDGLRVDVVSMRPTRGLAHAYNEAIIRSQSKYKIYMNHNVLILDTDFLHKLIAIFNAHRQIGILGLCGVKKLPDSLVWWEGEHPVGSVFESRDTLRYLDFEQPPGEVELVEALDGLFLATQYDLPWREDLFDGNYFYDISQCVEYQRNGYQVAVVRQDRPWCLHDLGPDNDWDPTVYAGYRERFRNEYVRLDKGRVEVV